MTCTKHELLESALFPKDDTMNISLTVLAITITFSAPILYVAHLKCLCHFKLHSTSLYCQTALNLDLDL